MKNLKISMLEFTPVTKEASRLILGGQAPSDYGACPTTRNNGFSGFCQAPTQSTTHVFNRFCRDGDGEIMVVKDWFDYTTGNTGNCIWLVV